MLMISNCVWCSRQLRHDIHEINVIKHNIHFKIGYTDYPALSSPSLVNITNIYKIIILQAISIFWQDIIHCRNFACRTGSGHFVNFRIQIVVEIVDKLVKVNKIILCWVCSTFHSWNLKNTIFEREDQFLLEKVYEIVLYYIAFVCIWTRDWIAF